MHQTKTYPTVGEVAAARPAAMAILERLGLDYCCGGKTPLDEACAAKGLDVAQVLREVETAQGAAPQGEQDWRRATLTDLCDHIITVHHGYLRREMPRLETLAAKVAAVHGLTRPELPTVARLFSALRAELEQHMFKEEQILFPMCEALEQAQGRPEFHCGSVSNPIAVMELEHDGAGETVHTIRQLTDQYTPPECACASYRALLTGLADVENDLHQHIHEENNILFPRAIAREAELADHAA